MNEPNWLGSGLFLGPLWPRFPGVLPFLFPHGFLAQSDFGDKRFPPFVAMVYFAAGKQPLGLFFWSEMGVGSRVGGITSGPSLGGGGCLLIFN